jgi:hypothetical protein
MKGLRMTYMAQYIKGLRVLSIPECWNVSGKSYGMLVEKNQERIKK